MWILGGVEDDYSCLCRNMAGNTGTYKVGHFTYMQWPALERSKIKSRFKALSDRFEGPWLSVNPLIHPPHSLNGRVFALISASSNCTIRLPNTIHLLSTALSKKYSVWLRISKCQSENHLWFKRKTDLGLFPRRSGRSPLLLWDLEILSGPWSQCYPYTLKPT